MLQKNTTKFWNIYIFFNFYLYRENEKGYVLYIKLFLRSTLDIYFLSFSNYNIVERFFDTQCHFFRSDIAPYFSLEKFNDFNPSMSTVNFKEIGQAKVSISSMSMSQISFRSSFIYIFSQKDLSCLSALLRDKYDNPRNMRYENENII